MVKISYAKLAEFFYEKVQQGVYKDHQMPLSVKNGKMFKNYIVNNNGARIQIHLQILALVPCFSV